jgi:hypothetical protein
MKLAVSAEVIRDLIIDGEYLVECLEQRERGCVVLTLTLRSRAQPCHIQIETTETKLDSLFRALLQQNTRRPGDAATLKVGSQPVPVVPVDDLPADQTKPRRRRVPKAQQIVPQKADGRSPRAQRRPAAGRQLMLVPEVSPSPPEAASPQPVKRRGRPRSISGNDRR